MGERKTILRKKYYTVKHLHTPKFSIKKHVIRVLKSFMVMSSCNLSVFCIVFQAEGAEYMKALFPNSVQVLGTEVERKSRERKLYDESDLKVRYVQRYEGSSPVIAL